LEMFGSDDRPIARQTISMPAWNRYTRTTQEIFGAAMPAGAYVRYSSSAPLHTIGLVGDETTSKFTVQPFDTSAPPPAVVSSLTVSSTDLSFRAVAGGEAPASQSITLGSTGAEISFAIASSAAWLTTSVSSGTTPGTVSVSVNPARLATGMYNATLALTPGTQTLAVVLEVTATP
jgi:Viral BACON domain